MRNRIADFNTSLKEKTPEEVLSYFLTEFKGEIAFANSFGAEDQVILDMIYQVKKMDKDIVKIFTLDTGRLFNETYETMQYSNARYQISIDVYFPDQKEVEKMVNEKGINLFYEHVENRKMCCGIRKVDSIKRALTGKKAWITGLRREQTDNRNEIELVEWDEKFGLIKINPLIDWTEKEIWEYIRKNKVPYHALHDKGYPSIGCAPCTRAILPGEKGRDGRWWWENEGSQECGLHVK